jgi:hypothetical protein
MSNGSDARRLRYRAKKYAAVHLLLCRWLRHYAQKIPHRYVTLGGTELADVRSIHFIDPELLGEAVSIEEVPARLQLASATAVSLRQEGVDVNVIQGNLFADFTRESPSPHLFFVDLEGICAFGDYAELFGDLFQEQTIREGDGLLITSYLPPRVGWKRVYTYFEGEFRLLGAGTNNQKQEWYTRAHPAFTLYRALRQVDLQDALALTCFGGIPYRGERSPMAVFGYVVTLGATQFVDFVTNIPWHVAAYAQTGS